MALDTSKISGVANGCGKAPAIFSYTTPDALATVVADGYFNGLAGGFTKNDIVMAVVLDATTPVLAILVCIKAQYTDGVGFDCQFAAYEGVLGDTAATDTAGYQSDNFGSSIAAGAGNPDTLTAGAISKLYTYRNNTDVIATIVTAGYFDECTFLEPNDKIIIVANNDIVIANVTIAGTVVTATAIAFVP